jgi:high affinity sulfate transporter 1
MNDATMAKEGKHAERRSPFFQGILPLDKARLTPDILAGITLAALGIPEVMGYTKIIGTPVVTGLYTMLLPLLVFAVLGSSRHLVVSADSATAAMVAAALASQSLAACSPRYVALTGLVALVAGAMLLLARLFRLGFLADFLSRTVLVGFLSGVGIQVAFGELHGMLGLEKGGHGFPDQLFYTLEHLPASHVPSLLIALAVLAVIVGFDLLAPRFPGALLAVVGTIAASACFHWADRGVQVIGAVPRGLPHLGLPDVSWSDVGLVLPIAGSCFIVILAQSAATSRAYALRYRDRFNQNVDLVGLALANAAAGCSNTFVVNGSPTKSAMVDTAGGRSQISHLTTAVVVLLVLLFLTRPLSFLPNPVLASIVFLIGVKLIDHRGLMEIYRKAPKEFFVAIATAATVVCVGVKEGILLALVLSLLQHVRHSYHPHAAVVLHDAHDHWRLEAAEPGRMIEPGLVMFWFGSDLFYANASLFTEKVRRLVDESPSPVRWLVVDASAITEIDYSAGRAVLELQQDLAKAGVVLGIARMNRQDHGNFYRLGLAAAIGEDHIFASRRQCLAAYQAACGGR